MVRTTIRIDQEHWCVQIDAKLWHRMKCDGQDHHQNRSGALVCPDWCQTLIHFGVGYVSSQSDVDWLTMAEELCPSRYVDSTIVEAVTVVVRNVYMQHHWWDDSEQMVVVIEGCKLCATRYNGYVVGPYSRGNGVPWLTNGNDCLVIHTYHGISFLMLDSQFLHHVELVGSVLWVWVCGPQ